MCHYIEAEIREALGETQGGLGYPEKRLKTVQGYLRGLRGTLQKYRTKWIREMDAIDSKRRQVTDELVRRVLKDDERRRDFEARWAEAKARGLRELDAGTYTGEVQPIGLRPPEASKKRASGECSTEESKETKTYLRPLEDPPEGPRRPVVGGSTGSNEDPPPPVVPLEAPPLPPPEELPEESRGEGVLPRMAEAPARLRVEEYQELEDEFIRVAKPEDLRHEDFLMWAAVRDTGLGTCSKCRWGSGCLHCDVRKAWAYACRSTL